MSNSPFFICAIFGRNSHLDMKIRIIAYFCAMSACIASRGQVLEQYMMANPQQLSEMVDSLKFICPPNGGNWVNTDSYDYPRGVKTKLSIIHFASFDDVRSRQTIQALSNLQAQLPTLHIAVVHNPRFSYPSTAQDVEREIFRLGSNLPVHLAQDKHWAACNQIVLQPTTLFLAPGGKVMERKEGALQLMHLEAAMRRLMPLYEELIALNKEPFYPKTSLYRKKKTVLREPYGLAVNNEESLLYVSDMGGQRIIAITPSGDMVYHIGTGRSGYMDGEMRQAEFNQPAGLAFHQAENTLYISDAGNHRIRKVDLRTKQVSTLLGNGLPGKDEQVKIIGTAGSINFPTSLYLNNNDLYISAAGSSEIWVCDVRTGVAEKLAGPATESGDSNKNEVPIGQPAGLTSDGSGLLYFLDAKHSDLCSIDSRKISTLLGNGPDNFGYNDGKKDKVKFQYPLGICQVGNDWYVADSYNHAIRKVQPYRKTTETLAGNGSPGYKNGKGTNALFRTPTDVALLGNELFVTDAGNGLIRKIDLSTNEVTGVPLFNYEAIGYGASDRILEVRDCEEIVIAPGENLIAYSLDLGPLYAMDIQGFSNAALSTANPDDAMMETEMRTGKFTVLIHGLELEKRNSFSFDLQLFFADTAYPERQYTRGVTYVQNFTVKEGAPAAQEVLILFDPDSE